MKKSKPWTEAHQKEALRRTYEIAAEVSALDPGSASWLAYVGACGQHSYGFTATESEWREGLAAIGAGPKTKGLEPARIDREVRRVRGLAEGRLVRETGWRVGGIWYADEAVVDTLRHHGPAKRQGIVRVTRIRKVTR